MGHRALVAYERQDEPNTYDVRYSHWGANTLKLTTLIAPGDPLGDGYVDEEVWFENITLEEVTTEHLDYLHHEAFYVVDPNRNVAPLRTLCTALFDAFGHGEPETETTGNGFLTTVRWYDGDPVGDGWVKGKFQGIKDVTGDRVEAGELTNEQAQQYMYEKMGGEMESNTIVDPNKHPHMLGSLVEKAREESPTAEVVEQN